MQTEEKGGRREKEEGKKGRRENGEEQRRDAGDKRRGMQNGERGRGERWGLLTLCRNSYIFYRCLSHLIIRRACE